jgi:hypothetical protein
VNERDEIPIETTGGKPSGNALGERAMVIFVIVILLGAAVILVGKYGGDPEAVASGSPGASVRASATQLPEATRRPTPTPQVVAVTPGDLPKASANPGYGISTWIRADRDLVIRDSAALVAGEVGVLKKGAFALATRDPNLAAMTDGYRWMEVNVPEPTGWIAVGTASRTFIHSYATPQYAMSGAIGAVTFGGGRYAAIVTVPGPPDRPQSSFIATSVDGATWRRVDMRAFGGGPVPSTQGPMEIAWGPTGWIAIAEVGEGGLPWLWRSQDGVAWTSLGSLVISSSPDVFAGQLVGSVRGYLLRIVGRTSRIEIWYSPDGITWVQTRLDPLGTSVDVRLAATSLGFYASGISYDQPSAPNAGYFSADGRAWSRVEGGPSGYGSQVAEVESALVGADLDPETGFLRVWTGRISQQQLTWSHEQADQLFTGAGFVALASDGHRAMLVGVDRSTNAPKAWTGSGAEWTPLPLPGPALGGLPTEAAGGPAGFVVVGYRSTLRGGNPIFWHQTAGGWAPEDAPVLPLVPDPTSAECTQAVPRDAAALAGLDRALAAFCFGDAPITLRAYAVPCNGCGDGGGTRDRYVPDWLANPNPGALFLAPLAIQEGGFTPVRLPPTLGLNAGWASHWLEVTGHFDDPASATCRWYPDPATGGIVAIAQSTIDQCRQEFVVTAVRVVSGP